ncbi:33909_t:CDS:2, partial [Racocetra persica]
WMANTIHQLTPARRLRKPLYTTFAQWVIDSWDEVDLCLIYNLADENNENSEVVGLDINSEEYEEVDDINN